MGFPGPVRASPSLFHKMGSFAGVRSAVSSAFRNRFGFFDSASIQGNGPPASFYAFSDGRHHRCFSRRRRRLHYDLPLSCANLN